MVICINSFFASAASDVDPGNIGSLRTTEPAIADDNVTEQTVREQPVEQTVVAATVEPRRTRPKTRPGRAPRQGAMRPPPPSSVAEEGNRIPTPPPTEEERAPTPAPAEASTLEGSPSQGKGPMIPVAVAGGSAEGEEAHAASDDEVEEI